MCSNIGHECNCWRERKPPIPLESIIPNIYSWKYLDPDRPARVIDPWERGTRVDLPNTNQGLLDLLLPVTSMPNWSFSRLRGQGKFDGAPSWYHGSTFLNGNS